MLVEDYLVAVVSLPAGVFNPYSGVKTSILILDKSLAKKTSTIAFFKVENDGFGLGAQRREIDKNDLPQAHAEIGEYLRRLRAGESVEDFQPTLGLIVAKEKIAANGDYNLSGERYREGAQRSSQYPHVELGEVVEILDSLRRPITKHDRKPGPYPYYGATGILDYVEGYLFDEPLVLVGEDGAKWGAAEQSAFAVEGKVWVNNHAHVLRPKRDRILDRYLIEILNEADLMQYITGVTVPKLNQEKLRSIPIPLPPLEVQKEIVAEIEGCQKVINGARAVLDHYRPHIPVHPDWPMVKLGETLKTSSGGTPLKGRAEYYENGTVPWVKSGEVGQGLITSAEERITEAGLKNSSAKIFPAGTVLVAMYGATAGQVGLLGIDASTNQAVCGILPDPSIVPAFLFFHLKGRTDELIGLSTGGAQPNISQAIIRALSIPLPPLATQQAIVAEIEAEQALVAANRELVARFEKKIQATLARVWGNEP